jgi:hypothetical protein
VALLNYLRDTGPEALVFHELPLFRGDRRADVVAVNGAIVGYEIKSDRDSLSRIRGQASGYASVCDYMTIIVAPRHLRAVRELMPARWGIMIAETINGDVRVRRVRKPLRNPAVNPESLIRLLWRHECAKVLRKNGIRPAPNALVIDLWQLLATLPLRRLKDDVREALKARGRFEPAELRTSSDGLRPKRPTPADRRDQIWV